MKPDAKLLAAIYGAIDAYIQLEQTSPYPDAGRSGPVPAGPGGTPVSK